MLHLLLLLLLRTPVLASVVDVRGDLPLRQLLHLMVSCVVDLVRVSHLSLWLAIWLLAEILVMCVVDRGVVGDLLILLLDCLCQRWVVVK